MKTIYSATEIWCDGSSINIFRDVYAKKKLAAEKFKNLLISCISSDFRLYGDCGIDVDRCLSKLRYDDGNMIVVEEFPVAETAEEAEKVSRRMRRK